jgi:Flp pilus assembly protein TadB
VSDLGPSEKAGSTSLGDLLSGVSQDISTLFRQEVELAKAELTESAKRAGKGAGLYGGAGVTALFALLFVSIAVWWGLGYLVGNAWSAVIVAVIYAVVALILFLRGRTAMKSVKGAPKTVDSLKKIPETLKPGGN